VLDRGIAEEYPVLSSHEVEALRPSLYAYSTAMELETEKVKEVVLLIADGGLLIEMALPDSNPSESKMGTPSEQPRAKRLKLRKMDRPITYL